MRNNEEFKAEVFRRAEETLRQKAKRKRRLHRYLSMAACFVLMIGVLTGTTSMLNRLLYDNSMEEATPTPINAGTNTQDSHFNATTPAETIPIQTSVNTTSNTDHATIPALTTPADKTPANTTPSHLPMETTPATTTPSPSTAGTTPTNSSSGWDGVTSPSETAATGILVRLPEFRVQSDSGTVEIVEHTSPSLTEDFSCIPFESYAAYESSPYFSPGVITADSFEEYTVYLLIAPAMDKKVCITVTIDQYPILQDLAANVHTEDGSYCVYALFVDPNGSDVDFSN